MLCTIASCTGSPKLPRKQGPLERATLKMRANANAPQLQVHDCFRILAMFLWNASYRGLPSSARQSVSRMMRPNSFSRLRTVGMAALVISNPG